MQATKCKNCTHCRILLVSYNSKQTIIFTDKPSGHTESHKPQKDFKAIKYCCP